MKTDDLINKINADHRLTVRTKHELIHRLQFRKGTIVDKIKYDLFVFKQHIQYVTAHDYIIKQQYVKLIDSAEA